MSVINVNGRRINVDIEEELRQYTWNNARWNGTKLIASSPFRDDFAPSFFVDLETGGWLDSGAYGSYYEKGNFVKLLAYLRNESEQDTVTYLVDKYGVIGEIKHGQDLRIVVPKLETEHTKEYVLTESTVKPAISPYLISRGIAPQVQEEFNVGYNANNKGFTAIPWHYHDTGEIANVKYRSTRNKRFFYEPNAKPINELVYGLYQAREYDNAVICEGEIDALSWWTAGIPAIATGGAHISDRQVEMIVQAGFDVIYLGGDNDDQGKVFNDQLRDRLRGYAELRRINYGKEKDANDVLLRHGVDELVEIYDNSQIVKTISLYHQI